MHFFGNGNVRPRSREATALAGVTLADRVTARNYFTKRDLSHEQIKLELPSVTRMAPVPRGKRMPKAIAYGARYTWVPRKFYRAFLNPTLRRFAATRRVRPLR